MQQKNQILHLPVNKLKLLMGVSDGDRRRGQVRYPPGRAGRLAIDCHGGPRDGQGGECEPELHLRGRRDSPIVNTLEDCKFSDRIVRPT